MFLAGKVSSILMELPLDMRVLDKYAGGEVLVRFRSAPTPFPRRPTAEVTAEVLAFREEPRKGRAIMENLGLKHWKTFHNNYLKPLMDGGLVAMTIPEKPRSSKQQYRTTEAGLRWLATK